MSVAVIQASVGFHAHSWYCPLFVFEQMCKSINLNVPHRWALTRGLLSVFSHLQLVCCGVNMLMIFANLFSLLLLLLLWCVWVKGRRVNEVQRPPNRFLVEEPTCSVSGTNLRWSEQRVQRAHVDWTNGNFFLFSTDVRPCNNKLYHIRYILTPLLLSVEDQMYKTCKM